MIKAFKVIPFNSSKEEIPLRENMFYVDIEQRPDYWKDVIIISSQSIDSLKQIQENLSQVKQHPIFKDKFVIINHYNNLDDKVNFYVLEELEGTIK